jgi:hypothetical protein
MKNNILKGFLIGILFCFLTAFTATEVLNSQVVIPAKPKSTIVKICYKPGLINYINKGYQIQHIVPYTNHGESFLVIFIKY